MNIGWQELVVLLMIVLIVFGAGKLPSVMKSLGQGVKEFKSEADAPLAAGTAVPASSVVAGVAERDAI